ncbi:MAG: hypothetical protein HRT58_13410 [Crocinitomicaceae bacterium]|nr:hypothetical protein [Flavobacteriales bacterium]NQZ36661.1 hypothetical protein [Crocinitomicaceae bacterium]
MIDVKDLLENDTIKGLLTKFGVSSAMAESVANQALSAIKTKFNKDPKQMSSLLSENKNTEKDEVLVKEVEDDFIDRLVKKVGIPEGMASQAKGAIPGILSQVTSKLSDGGGNNEGGIAGMLSNITDMFDGDEEPAKDGKPAKKKKSSGIAGLFSKFFGN